MSQEGHRGGCPQGPAVLGAILHVGSSREPGRVSEDLQGTCTMGGHPSSGDAAPPNGALQQGRQQGHICHLQDKVSPWQGDTHESDPTLGRAVGARTWGWKHPWGTGLAPLGTGLTGAHVVEMGQVWCQPLEGNEGVSVWEVKAWGTTSDGFREGKGQDRDTTAVTSPGTTPGTWHWGTW